MANGEWPTGWIDEPKAAWYAAQIARTVLEVLQVKRWNLNQAAQTCGIDRETLVRVVQGETYPDLVTLTALELGLDVKIWPSGPIGGVPRK